MDAKRIAKLAVGECCLPNCRVCDKAVKGLSSNMYEIPTAQEFVSVSHSKPGHVQCCSVMHLRCFEDFRASMHSRIVRACAAIKSSDQVNKAMFDESRSGKYHLIRQWCTCKCGGLFRVDMDRRGEPIFVGHASCTSVSPTSVTRKKRVKKKAPTLQPIPLTFRDDAALDNDLVDQDLEQYIWRKRETLPADQPLPAPEFEFVNAEFRSLPPSPPRASTTRPVTMLTRKAFPDIRIHNTDGVVIIALAKDGVDKWKPALVGRGGCKIAALELKFCSKISIQDSHSSIRIVVRGGHDSDRRKCSQIICSTIEERCSA